MNIIIILKIEKSYQKKNKYLFLLNNKIKICNKI